MSPTLMSPKVTPDSPEWDRWLEICDYTGWNPYGPLKPMKYHGRIVPYCGQLGITPRFFNELMERIHKVQPIRMAIVGEPGSSKTYTGISIAQVIDKLYKILQVIITAKGYMDLVQELKPKRAITLEEPTFHLAARTWWKDWQQIIVQTIESTRFQNNPLLIPVVNRNLLDKTVREYYINYVIHMFGRGVGRVYRTKHSQWEDRLKRTTAFNIYIYSPGIDLTECGRLTCLECPKLYGCELKLAGQVCSKKCTYFEEERDSIERVPCKHFGCRKNIWPLYERKRAGAIAFYQKEGAKKVEKAIRRPLNFRDICKLALIESKDFLTPDGKSYEISDIMVRFEVGHNIAVQVRNYLLKYNPPPKRRPK